MAYPRLIPKGKSAIEILVQAPRQKSSGAHIHEEVLFMVQRTGIPAITLSVQRAGCIADLTQYVSLSE
ncbi:hypothetical protein ASG35_15835 [Burkholderia sp. Leaf177]|nr:hypothetical protein ASG35_15835 [Burkholderia sp. Leaf177]